MSETMLVGAGKAAIVLGESFFPEEYHTGIYDDIHVRAVLLEAGERFLLISMELPSIKPFSLIDGMREKMGILAGTDAAHVWICMTHDTSAPHVPPAGPDCVHDHTNEKRAMFLSSVHRAMEKAVREAVNTFRPAKLKIGIGSSAVNCNRNVDSLDGQWNGLNLEGFSDKRLTVMQWVDRENCPIAVIYHYCMKTAVMDGAKKADGTQMVTADVTGYASGYVEKLLHAPTLFLMGAAADQVPRHRAEYFERSGNGHLRQVVDYFAGLEAISSLGDELGRDILGALEDAKSFGYSEIRCFEETLTLEGQINPRRNVPATAYDFQPGEHRELLLQYLRLGDAAVLVGIKPELSCKIGTRIRDESVLPNTLVVDMVNGGQGYLPQSSCYAPANYESLHSEFWCGSAEVMADHVCTTLAGEKQRG